MIKIELHNADNGIIKKVIDTQFNGADQSAEIVTLYEIEEEDLFLKYTKIVKILHELTKDLNIDIGSDYSHIRLAFELKWGEKYNPSVEEVNEYIKTLNSEIRMWKDYKKVIENNPNIRNV
jgi:hypothetical protein